MDDDYIEVPVTVDYNPSDVIGVLRVRADRLPKPPDYLFAVGGVVKEIKGREDGTREITDFTLLEVTLLPESQYDWSAAQRGQEKALTLPPPRDTEDITKTS